MVRLIFGGCSGGAGSGEPMDGCWWMEIAIGNNRMPVITLKLTDQELGLLTNLAADQLFRREFIDPKMPGYKFNPGELSLGKKLVERLRQITERATNSRVTKAG
jgi:hypothetical protein